MPPPRRTQAQRRRETRANVLESATRLFGESGYNGTSLEEIALAAGTTIRPIYHYFGNKRALFEAVTEELEAHLLEVLVDPIYLATPDGHLDRFRACLGLLARPNFQRVVLVDAPAVLGQGRWTDAPVTRAASEQIAAFISGDDPVRAELIRRMMIGALTQAAVSLAECETPRELDERVEALIGLAAVFLPARA